MEPVKICPECNNRNAATAWRCVECGADLTLVTVGGAALEASSAERNPPACPPSGFLICSDANCGAVNAPGRDRCEICQTRLIPAGETLNAAALGVEWPWGLQALPDYLGIGRDPGFSSLAALLEGYTTVSGSHAIIEREGKGFVLRDVGSTNGTYVGGQKIQPNAQILLSEGMLLRFSQRLNATIRRIP